MVAKSPEEKIVVHRPSNCQRLGDKNAVVTAGTKGIGLGIVYRLLDEGAKVYLCSRKAGNVTQILEQLGKDGFGSDRVNGEACHVGDFVQLKAFVDNSIKFFGTNRIDVVVSNAAVNPIAGHTLDLPDDVYDKIFDVNVKSSWKLVQFCRPHMVRGGSIIFISSVGGHQPAPPVGIYGVSKTSMIALARVLSLDLGKDGIRVNTICPGIIRTDMSKLFWERNDPKKTCTLGVFGDPVDIGGAAAFLASDDSQFMTGESIVLSGGSGSRL